MRPRQAPRAHCGSGPGAEERAARNRQEAAARLMPGPAPVAPSAASAERSATSTAAGEPASRTGQFRTANPSPEPGAAKKALVEEARTQESRCLAPANTEVLGRRRTQQALPMMAGRLRPRWAERPLRARTRVAGVASGVPVWERLPYGSHSRSRGGVARLRHRLGSSFHPRASRRIRRTSGK